MAGVGKLIKQAHKMQKQMQLMQDELSKKEIVYSSGGGAITVKINGTGDILDFKVDSDFLKEEKTTVELAILEAFKNAIQKARDLNNQMTESLSGGMQLPF